MNVLLVITNINGFHEIPYSFALSGIDSYIKKKGYNSKIFAVRSGEDYKNLFDEIKIFKPRVVGFTVVSSQVRYVKKAIEQIKAINKEIIIVCGGVHPTLDPESLLETGEVDGVFIGESEIAFGDFLDKIRNNLNYSDVNNFAYKKNGKINKNSILPLLQDLDVLPYPTKNYLFEEQIKKNGYAPFFFSRGCPFLCSYCSNESLAKIYNNTRNKVRYRSVDSCILEIQDAIAKYDFDTVIISDDTFGINKKWRKEFCEKYKVKINKKFICLLRVNIVDEEFIKLLKHSGCHLISFGVESGNDYVRNTIMKRGITKKQLLTSFNLCHKYDIRTCALNIIGVPGETEEMIWDTIKLNRKLAPTSSGINIFYPYKGTPLGDYCFSEGLVDEERYDHFSNERRDSVLKYSEEQKKRLRYFHENWTHLVYPTDIKKRTLFMLQNHKLLYRCLRKIKKAVDRILRN